MFYRAARKIKDTHWRQKGFKDETGYTNQPGYTNKPGFLIPTYIYNQR